MTCHKFLSFANKEAELHKRVKEIEVQIRKFTSHLHELVYKALNNSKLIITKNMLIHFGFVSPQKELV